MIGVVRTSEPLQLVDPKHAGGKAGDQKKARGKQIAHDSDADEVSNSVVNTRTKVIDLLNDCYVSLLFCRKQPDE